MQKLKKGLLHFILLILSLLAIYFIYPHSHPHAGIKLPDNRIAIEQKTGKLLEYLKIEEGKFQRRLTTTLNRELILNLQKQYGIYESNKLFKRGIPGYYFKMDWKEPLQINFGEDKSKENSRWHPLKTLTLYLDDQGNLLELIREIPDTLKLLRLSEEKASMMAYEFMSSFTRYKDQNLDTSNTILPVQKRIINMGPGGDNKTVVDSSDEDKVNRTDYLFTWSSELAGIELRQNIKLSITGNAILKLERSFNLPDQASANSNIYYIIRLSILTILFFLIGILSLVVGFKRLRAYELGFKLALGVSIGSILLFALSRYFEVIGEPGIAVIAMIIFLPLFYGIGIFILFAIAESIARDSWPNKFFSIDLLSKGFINHSRIGQSILRGLAIGSLACGVMLALIWLFDQMVPLSFISSDSESMRLFDVAVPSLYLISHTLADKVYAFTFFVLLVYTLIVRKIGHGRVAIILTALFFALYFTRDISPFYVGLIIYTILGLFFIGTFAKYEAFDAFIAMCSFAVLLNGTSFLFIDSEHLFNAGLLGLGFISIFLIYSLLTMVTQDAQVKANSISPTFVQYINERQRLQRELEIARTVQMDFLPNKVPEFEGLEIAAQCIPALEVGGDYYDFISISNEKLGVAIGDVSGKGTSAAFYMTLTKGYLQAIAQKTGSAVEVLKQVNQLFYQNARRNIFISMVYGVFDLRHKTLLLARAGHNPVIMHQKLSGEVQEIQSEGLALGLDSGSKFNSGISEATITFQSGDIFLFYTDGLSEAMNRNKEVYGQERLCSIINSSALLKPEQIKEAIFKDIRSFTGKSEQHDDMSLVVLKVV